jgi:hypothetical protein
MAIVAVAISGVFASGVARATAQREPPRGIPRFTLESTGLFSRGSARSWASVIDQGRRSAVFATETGAVDAWVWPLRLIQDLQLSFRLPERSELITGVGLARDVVTRPEGITFIYAHAAFTVRQHVFVPINEPGVIVLLDIASTGPLEIIVSMKPDLSTVWPTGAGGGQMEWQPDARRYWLVQNSLKPHHGLIGSPFASSSTTGVVRGPGVTTQFALAIDAAVAARQFVPIVIAGGPQRDSAELVYRRLLDRAPSYWRDRVAHFREVRQSGISIAGPDPQVNQAFDWAKINFDQQQVCATDSVCGLAAGFGRHGLVNSRFGPPWYLGGNVSIPALGLSSIGQFDLLREGLRRMVLRQNTDGSIGSSETTAFWLTAVHAYWAATGDQPFLTQNWTNIARAFRWGVSTDSDADGLMENRRPQGPGVSAEVWTDVHLASAWIAALEAVSDLARAAGDDAIATQAAALYERAQRSLESKFWSESAGVYGAALTSGGPGAARPVLNEALTVWPSTAMVFGIVEDARANRTLREIASSAITTDWGTRATSLQDDSVVSSVSLFATELAALANYRYHRGWAGFDLLKDAARATFDFARGRTPEHLSSDFYTAFGGAPQHSNASAMFVAALVRGLIGVQTDASNQALLLEPHLPAEWSTLSVNGVAVGAHRVFATIRRGEGRYEVSLRKTGPNTPLFVRLSPALPLGARIERARVNDRDVATQTEETAHDVHAIVELSLSSEAEIEIEYTGGLDVSAPAETIEIGDRSSGLRVLDFLRDGRDYVVLVEGEPAATYTLTFRSEVRVRSVSGADLVDQGGQRLVLRLRIGTAAAAIGRREIRIRT